MRNKQASEFFGNELKIIFLRVGGKEAFHIGYILDCDDTFLYVHDPKCGDLSLPLCNIESVKNYKRGSKNE